MSTEPEVTDSSPEPEITPVDTPQGRWTLVRAGTWEISVGPDGLLMLPRHLDPREVEDFITSARKAAELGASVQEENQRNTTPLGDLPARRALVTPAGRTPPGAVPMTVSAVGTNQPTTGSIGRRGPSPQANRAAMPGQSPRR